MIKIKFHKDFISRYESFLNSIVFNKQSDYSKSIYWDYHSKLIKSEIKDNTLYLDGLSGNYIPPKKNSLNLYIRSLKTLKIGRAHVRTPVTSLSRMPSSA